MDITFMQEANHEEDKPSFEILAARKKHGSEHDHIKLQAVYHAFIGGIRDSGRNPAGPRITSLADRQRGKYFYKFFNRQNRTIIFIDVFSFAVFSFTLFYRDISLWAIRVRRAVDVRDSFL